MKLRNFIIVLLAVLMAFAFASCKNEPEAKPNPTPSNSIYKLTATTGRNTSWNGADKFTLHWDEEVAKGDTLTLKFRATCEFSSFSLRNDSCAWVYEKGSSALTSLELGDDGWYSLVYEFTNTFENGSKAAPVYGTTTNDFRIDFRGNILEDDYVEFKDVALNGEPLEIEAENVYKHEQAYGAVNPTLEVIADHAWKESKSHVIFFAVEEPGDSALPFDYERVADGTAFQTDLSRANYTFTLYEDAGFTQAFAADTPITKDMTIFVKYVGDERAVTFVVPEGATPVEATTTFYKTPVDKPEDPTMEGKAFKAWYTDAEFTAEYDFSTPVENELTLYAKFTDPLTVTFQANNGEVPETKIVAQGNAVAKPIDPENGTYLFLGWFSDSGCTALYNFATPVTTDITIYALWGEPVDVTLNLNYEGAPEPTVYKAPYGEAIAEDDENLAVEDDIIGMVYGGWYTDAECTTPYNYETVVTTPFTLYAKWTEATLYRLIAKKNGADDIYTNDKIAVNYKSSADPYPYRKVSDGDVLSFRYRTTKPNTGFSIRGDKKWIYQNMDAENNYGLTSFEVVDGWTYVTYEFDSAHGYDTTDAQASNAWFEVHFYNRYNEPSDNVGIEIGDVLEIQDWAINGEPLAITADNVSGYAGATLSIVEGGAYEWTAHTVEFDTDGGSDIDADSVDFGGRVSIPADPTKAGSVFSGWYADAELTIVFDFVNTPILEDTTIYAKWVSPVTLTFDSQEGSAVDAISTGAGLPIAKPADPARDGYLFQGWFEEAGCTTPFDFAAGIAADKTVYAKWIIPLNLTFDLNYPEAPESQVAKVGVGVAITVPKNPARVGYFFGGWCEDEDGENAFDFEAGIAADKVIYAKWVAPTEAYQFTSTVEETRWQFRWHEDTIEMFNGKINAGDVFTLMLKFPGSNTLAENYWRLRTRSGEKHITEDTTFASTTKDGEWYLITAVVPEEITNGSGLYLQVYGAGEAKWPIGSVMIIKAFAYNGQAIEIDARAYGTASTHKGAYEKVAANGAVIAP